MRIQYLIEAIFSGGIKGHFGQWAEDVIVRKLFPKNKNHGIYLDLGAYHPFIFSNTSYLHMKGWHGFNVDANPKSIELFKRYRPNDINIWAGIISEKDYKKGIRDIELFGADIKKNISSTGSLNKKISKERRFGESILVPAKSISSLTQEYHVGHIDYLNIDIEGSDDLILCEIDFLKISPKVVSVEDYKFNLRNQTSNINKTLFKHGYDLAGRAGPTSIFVR